MSMGGYSLYLIKYGLEICMGINGNANCSDHNEIHNFIGFSHFK